MDRVDRLRQEAESELERIHSRHQKEWYEILAESQIALSKAKTVKEIKTVNKDYKQRFELLSKRQQDELKKVNEDFVRALLNR